LSWFGPLKAKVAAGDAWGKAFGIKVSVGLDLSAEFNPFRVCATFHIAGSHSICVP